MVQNVIADLMVKQDFISDVTIDIFTAILFFVQYSKLKEFFTNTAGAYIHYFLHCHEKNIQK